MDISKDQPTRVCFLLIEGFALLSYAAAIEPLRAANKLAGQTLYKIRHALIANDGSPVRQGRSSTGAIVPATAEIGQDLDFDLVLAVAGGDPLRYVDSAAFPWLRQLSHRGVTLGGVSGGPVILALAGLMAGRRMTVHWEHTEALTERLPSLLLERSLFVIDRDRVTCAGGTAALDLMHAMIADHHGADFAREVSDWFMHTEIRSSGSQQRAGLVDRYGTNDPSVIRALEAMENHIADPLDLTGLAMLTGIGERQLNRLFRDKLGRSTMAVYRDMRLEKARNLLSQSTLSATEIALATGFANSSHFAQSFRDRFQVTPSSVRR